MLFNISMGVKNKENPLEKVRNILKDQNGILLTSDLAKFGIRRTFLSILVKNGEVQRISRGVYSAANYLTEFRTRLFTRPYGR